TRRSSDRTLKQLDAFTLNLVGTDALQRSGSDTGKMSADECWIQLAHGHSRNGNMPPNCLAISSDNDRAVQLMCLARKGEQVTARSLHICRLVENLVPQRKSLVAANNPSIREPLRYLCRLCLCQDRSDIFRVHV